MKKHMVFHWPAIGFLMPAFLMLICGGCGAKGPPPVAVSGNVSFEGKPVTQGIVLFMSEQGFGSSAEINSRGNYALRSQYGKGIPAGTYRVIVTPLPEVVSESDVPSPSAKNDTHPEIPKKYRDFATSGLEVSLNDQPTVFDIPLKAK